ADPRNLLRVVRLLVLDLLPGSRADCPKTPEPGVVDDEVQVAPVLRGFLQVVWAASFLVEEPQRKPLVNAHRFHAQLERLFTARIRDLLVIEEPRLLAQLRSGIALPCVNFEFLHLALHFLQFLRTQVRAKKAMGEYPLRACEVVDILPRRYHLIGWER